MLLRVRVMVLVVVEGDLWMLVGLGCVCGLLVCWIRVVV